MMLPAFAAEHHRYLQHGARSYRSISPADAGAQQQTHRLTLLLSIDGTDGRQSPDCYIDPAADAVRAASRRENAS